VADVVTTAGDLLYATAADTVTRLGIGTASQVLAVNSGATAPEWVTPAAGGGMTLLSTTTITAAASISITGINQSYKQLQVRIKNAATSGVSESIRFTLNSVTSSTYSTSAQASTTGHTQTGEAFVQLISNATSTANTNNLNGTIIFPNYASTTGFQYGDWSIGGIIWQSSPRTYSDTIHGSFSAAIGAISSIQLSTGTGTWTAQGTIEIYGVN
jgi:hypothetical protein